jgi:hypothetical protein
MGINFHSFQSLKNSSIDSTFTGNSLQSFYKFKSTVGNAKDYNTLMHIIKYYKIKTSRFNGKNKKKMTRNYCI